MNVAFNVVANCFPLMLIVMLLLYALVCCFSLMFLSVHLSSKTVLFSLLSSDNVYTDGDYVKHCFFPLSFTVVFWFLNYFLYILFSLICWSKKSISLILEDLSISVSVDRLHRLLLVHAPFTIGLLVDEIFISVHDLSQQLLARFIENGFMSLFYIIIYFDYPLWIGVLSTFSSCSFVAILSWFMPSNFMQILV